MYDYGRLLVDSYTAQLGLWNSRRDQGCLSVFPFPTVPYQKDGRKSIFIQGPGSWKGAFGHALAMRATRTGRCRKARPPWQRRCLSDVISATRACPGDWEFLDGTMGEGPEGLRTMYYVAWGPSQAILAI